VSGRTSRARHLLLLGAGGAALATAGCRGQQSALDPRGPGASLLFELSLVMFIGGAVVFALVMTALAVALLVRGREARERPEQRRRTIRVVGAATGGTLAAVTALLVYSVTVSRAIPYDEPADLEIEVVGHQWWWEITYVDRERPSHGARTANEIHIPVGKRVAFHLKSFDVIHSFWVPNLHGKLDAIPGKQNRLVLRADEPGVFRGQCAEFCGLQHAKMAFFVVAEAEDEFERWLERERRSARPPADPLAERGQEVFLSGPCGMCHAIRGTTAMAAAGPDLTHIASRTSLASGVLDQNRGNMAGWILDPQHTKPGTRMPASALDADALDALLHYLGTLE
jgi:cytochrome c oxidase subunit II